MCLTGAGGSPATTTDLHASIRALRYCSLRVYLLHNGTRFPRMRYIRVLYGMLPPGGMHLSQAANYRRDRIRQSVPSNKPGTDNPRLAAPLHSDMLNRLVR